MKFDPEIHHRRSIRLKGYDYSQPGAYFITLVTYRRGEIFGEVVNAEMKLSTIGQIVWDEWMRSIQIRKEIRLYEDEFMVMPNHLHAIVWMVDSAVGADGVRPDHPGVIRFNDNIDAIEKGARRAPLPSAAFAQVRAPKSLGSFIAGFKASVTSRAKRKLNLTNIWQRNYYEHIIRSETDFKNIWNYINDNPRTWEADQLYPSAPSNQFNQE